MIHYAREALWNPEMKDDKEMQSIIFIIQSCIIIVIKQSALGKGTFTHELICDFNSSLFQSKASITIRSKPGCRERNYQDYILAFPAPRCHYYREMHLNYSLAQCSHIQSMSVNSASTSVTGSCSSGAPLLQDACTLTVSFEFMQMLFQRLLHREGAKVKYKYRCM